MTAIDQKNFTTLGQGLWWAVQTVTTVGYGDLVPSTVAGQLVAALVMLFGLAFLAVVTAAIASAFVSRATEERARRAGAAAPATQHDVRDINERLDRLEALGQAVLRPGGRSGATMTLGTTSAARGRKRRAKMRRILSPVTPCTSANLGLPRGTDGSGAGA